VDHLRRLTRDVLEVAQEVEAGVRPPSDLVRVAYAAHGALDNEYPEWKKRLWDLSLDTDAVVDPWPPHASELERRYAVLAAAEPHL
jgi:hypothetical protein